MSDYSELNSCACGSYQHRKVDWRKRSHTGTELHTHVVVESDLDLGLTLHHPWQAHRYCTLGIATTETSEQGFVEGRPGDKVVGKTLLKIKTISHVT